MRLVSVAVMCVWAAAACTTGSGGAPAQEQQSHPNVLVIMTDDQPTFDTLRVMPRTRRWFKDGGAHFTNAYATTPLCCPSRASIFTGRYAHNHDVIRSTPGQAQKLVQESTLQRYLADAGYRNAIFGKYLNGWDLAQDPPFFDEWAIFEGGKPLGYYDGSWNVNGRWRTISRYSNSFIQAQALRFLEGADRRDEQPWMMFVNVYGPHIPFLVPERFEKARIPSWKPDPAVTEKDLSDKPPFATRTASSFELAARLREQQLRALLPVDELVGEVMSYLKELGEDEDTLAFFVSDNGYMWGQHGLIKKSAPYTGSTQIPLFLRWPGEIAGGIIDDRLAANIDMAPTIYEATGITPDKRLPIDGMSLLGEPARDDLLLEYWPELPKRPQYVAWSSLLTDDYQYVEYYEDDLATVRFREYYDMQSDPWQLDNLVGDENEGNDPELTEIEDRLELLRSCAGPTCR